ncbi:ATP-dependent RNA helicase DDX35 [Neoconidiobolus thromboides FSU 785]|nr:ATP-dependent RNA helicase DDX35 [Neoconidiobolus thromboides FSU 785]
MSINIEETQSTNLIHLKLKKDRENLPIQEYKQSILYNLKQSNVLLLVSPTGSGKSTQLPQFLDEAKWTKGGRQIAITQPRRVAAKAVAEWVAQEMDTQIGKEVGYSIRFEEKSSELTRIKFLTDGMLVKEIYRDPLLSRYSVIMVDEAHERTVTTDLLISLLKKIQSKRKELRIIITSATVDLEKYERYFKNEYEQDIEQHKVSKVCLSAKSFPIDILYLKQPCENYIDKVNELVQMIHLKEPKGDILVFLTGREEIDTLLSELLTWSYNQKGKMELKILPFYSGLSTEEQEEIFNEFNNTRKVILATSIAETSLTIPGINYVIDPGFIKIRVYDPTLSRDKLVVVPISQATAKQRAGRAGRISYGKVYRLYTEETYEKMEKEMIAEIQRSELSLICLYLKGLGIDNLAKFNFFCSPPTKLMIKAMEYLYHLQILDLKGQLTIIGKKIIEFPIIDVRICKLILNSKQFQCTNEILTISAMLLVKNVFVKGSSELNQYYQNIKKFAVEEGDLITLLNVYNAFYKSDRSPKWCKNKNINYQALKQAMLIRNQLYQYFNRVDKDNGSNENNNINNNLKTQVQNNNNKLNNIVQCILSVYFDKIVQLDPISANLLHIETNQKLFIHPESVLFKRNFEYAIFVNIIETKQVYASNLTTIDLDLIKNGLPKDYKLRIDDKKNVEGDNRVKMG